MVTAHFRGIRKIILDEIALAQETIDVAVYWFTNHELLEALIESIEDRQVSVRLIVHNDYINSRVGSPDFQRFADKGGKFYFSKSDNTMHNKFCIIDGETLINGSYNWTYFAESKNSENILLLRQEKKVVADFLEEFDHLIDNSNRQTKVRKLSRHEVQDSGSLSTLDYLANDLICEAHQTNQPDLVETALSLTPRSIVLQKRAVNPGLVEQQKLRTVIGTNLVDDQYSVVIKANTAIPYSGVKYFQTSQDDQKSVNSSIFYGHELDAASKNTVLIKEVAVSNIPPKPAGKAETKMIISVDINGILAIEELSLDNGNTSGRKTVDISFLLVPA